MSVCQVELPSDKTLAAAGLAEKATVTAVRKVLVPEGWKVQHACAWSPA